ncbi:hypothetical protein RRG08_023667 [Elysia crispata]|uniref:Uncharacterized protein n=1 Tax=Elysia crispata TaxID=231223 RepID=A0AAE0XSJ6_9GAST|nr:hypothetical protein RRG08_023667 [Elysia crispata]
MVPFTKTKISKVKFTAACYTVEDYRPNSPHEYLLTSRRLAPGENQPEQTATEILTLFEISADVDIGNGALEFHYGNSDGSVGLRLIYVVIVFKQVPVIDVGSGLPGTALFMVAGTDTVRSGAVENARPTWVEARVGRRRPASGVD